MYQFPNKINYETFFRMSRDPVLNGLWGQLPLSSKAIYPVVAIHADKNNTSYPSQETIGIIAGCTPKTVREGLNGLIGYPGFYIDNWTTKKGNRAKIYTTKPAPNHAGSAIWIYRSFFDGGNWRQLLNTSKATYIALLAFSYFDYEIYCYLTGEEECLSSHDFFSGEHFQHRAFDIASPDLDVLADIAGITEDSAKNALIDLEKNYFIEKKEGYFKLFKSPPRFFTRVWLNGKLPTK